MTIPLSRIIARVFGILRAFRWRGHRALVMSLVGACALNVYFFWKVDWDVSADLRSRYFAVAGLLIDTALIFLYSLIYSAYQDNYESPLKIDHGFWFGALSSALNLAVAVISVAVWLGSVGLGLFFGLSIDDNRETRELAFPIVTPLIIAVAPIWVLRYFHRHFRSREISDHLQALTVELAKRPTSQLKGAGVPELGGSLPGIERRDDL